MKKDKIAVLIIESDSSASRHLDELLKSNAMVSSVISAEDTDAALLQVIESTPDIVFLEYPAKGKTGNGIIKFLQAKITDIIIVFVSETTNHAADAIHFGIYDYLLKPVIKSKLGEILENFQNRKQANLQLQINELIEKNQDESKLRFNTIKGFSIIDPDEILYCQSYGSYTEIFLTNKTKELAYMSLSKTEEVLVNYNFVRISRSILINKNYIRKLLKANNTFVLSSKGVEYQLKGSKSQIKALIKTDFES